MASYPPPYGYDAKAQRRMDKARWREQRAADRMQRALYREQLRGLRRRSLLGPLLLVTIGAVLLLARNGRFSGLALFDLYSRWWPMVFVLAGVVLLAEWAVDQALASRRPDVPMGRRRVGGGVVFLLILLALLGAGGMGVHSGAARLVDELGLDRGNWNGDGLAELLGEKHESEQTIDEKFSRGMSLSVENPHGDVTVTGESTDGRIHISVHRQIYSHSQAEADRRAEEVTPRVASNGQLMTVRGQGREGATVDLTITLPVDAATAITANRGDVRVTGIKAPVNVTVFHGDVELAEIGGDITTRINHNDSSFSAHNIVGSVMLKGHAQDLNVAEISGQLSLEGEFYGTTHLEKIHGPLRFHTSRTDLQVARLEGETEVSPDASLSVDQAAGPTVLTTRNRNITLDRLAGDLTVTNTNGSVDVVSAPPLGNVTIANRHGSVNVTLPERDGFTVQAETSDGGFENEFSLPQVTGDHTTSVSGTVGRGGPMIRITTSHGDIGLRKAQIEALPAIPGPPVPPVPPRSGGKAARVPASPPVEANRIVWPTR